MYHWAQKRQVTGKDGDALLRDFVPLGTEETGTVNREGQKALWKDYALLDTKEISSKFLTNSCIVCHLTL